MMFSVEGMGIKFAFKLIVFFILISVISLSTFTVKPNIGIYFRQLSGETNRSKVRSVANQTCGAIMFRYYGRIGNMFQYASNFGIAKTNDQIAYLANASIPIKHYFHLSMPVMDSRLETVFSEIGDSANVYDNGTETLNCSVNYFDNGFRHSCKYFDKYRSEIKQEFHFLPHIDYECNEQLINISIDNDFAIKDCLLIGAHMRRGDFVSLAYYGHVPADGVYLKRAIEFFENRYKNEKCLKFLIFGDDYDWNIANSQKGSDVIVSRTHSAPVDLCLLTRCNHTIMFSGSFGWWAAYVARGEATYMKHQCIPNSPLCRVFKKDDYFNPQWKWFPL